MFFRTVLRPTSTGFRENARYLFLCRNFVGYAKLFQSKLLVNNYVGLPNFSGKAAVSFYSTGAEGTVYTKIKHIFGLGKLPKSVKIVERCFIFTLLYGGVLDCKSNWIQALCVH